MSTSPTAFGDRLFLSARSLWLQHVAGLAARQLGEAEIPCILLKGPAIAGWLYDEDEVRLYSDIDLLVRPVDFDRAVEALAVLGYVHDRAGAASCEFGPNEKDLQGPNLVTIDLHRYLIGVSDPELCWEVLSRHVTPFRLRSGAEIDVLDVPARTMHLALHAAQDGPADTKAVEDLRRGLRRVESSDWRAAAAIAEQLGAMAAFAAGLRLVPAGAALAEQLSLPKVKTVEVAIRTASAPQEAIVFVRLAECHTFRAKSALVARKLFPTGAFLRSTSRLANHGPLGLLGARLWRPISLVPRFPPAYFAWRRARREAQQCAGKGSDSEE